MYVEEVCVEEDYVEEVRLSPYLRGSAMSRGVGRWRTVKKCLIEACVAEVAHIAELCTFRSYNGARGHCL